MTSVCGVAVAMQQLILDIRASVIRFVGTLIRVATMCYQHASCATLSSSFEIRIASARWIQKR
jgi:hypothetical protein